MTTEKPAPEAPQPAPLPAWVRSLLVELYHPLGKRRMQEAFAPFAEAMQRFVQAVEALERRKESQ